MKYIIFLSLVTFCLASASGQKNKVLKFSKIENYFVNDFNIADNLNRRCDSILNNIPFKYYCIKPLVLDMDIISGACFHFEDSISVFFQIENPLHNNKYFVERYNIDSLLLENINSIYIYRNNKIIKPDREEDYSPDLYKIVLFNRSLCDSVKN
ncbi:MAG: hypothetical protein ABI723_05050 [Bacteroidia bacterium]